jgi:hypothetical protein
MRAQKLTDLLIPQSGCGNTLLVSDGVTVTLQFEYRREGKDWIGLIRFEEVIAYRHRDELHSVGYPSESYESIAEIHNSGWSTELKCSVRHFAVFLTSNGYFEILAKEFSICEPSEGRLQ